MNVLNGVRAVLPLVLVLASGVALAQDCIAEASLKSNNPAKPLMGCDLSFLAQQIEVSPIEQFRLTGSFNIAPRGDQIRTLNSPASGSIDLIRANPQTESSQWEFEAVAGTPFVRIKSKGRDVVLKNEEGRLLAAPAQPDGEEMHWTLAPVDGLPFVQIRNRDTESFLGIVNGGPALVDDPEKEADSHWHINRPGAPQSAGAQPPNSAYQAAVANCGSLGGNWTGSSCRVAAATAAPDCGRGWAWSAETGECYWNGGGRCPPWQPSSSRGCQPDLACRGGRLSVSRFGHASCDCPPGAVAWGRYPQLSCVRSLARITEIAIAPLSAKSHSSASSPEEKTKISAAFAKLGLMRTPEQQARDMKVVQKVSPSFLAKLRKDGANARAANEDERRVLAVYTRAHKKAEVGPDYLTSAEKQVLGGAIKIESKTVATTPPLPPVRTVKQSPMDTVAVTPNKPVASTTTAKPKAAASGNVKNKTQRKTKKANSASSRKPVAATKCKGGKRLVKNKCV